MLTVNHKQCTGCGSCIEACPQLAVVTVRDKYKFIYPSVNAEQCISCGKCVDACPLHHSDSPPPLSPDVRYYAAKALDKALLRDSHAGGIFPLLARAVLSRGGVVYGCAFDEVRHPRHIRVEQPDDIAKLQGLKPVQSDTSGIFRRVRCDLEAGRTVLFSGTPCQCDGLRRFLGADGDVSRLILVDMLCGGVTSEGIFHRYVRWLEEKIGGSVRSLRFENKPAFGHSPGLRIIFRRGKFRYLLSVPAAWDMLYAMYRKGCISRRACGDCRYAVPARVGDITLGRFERIRRAHPDFPYDNGVSLVITSTPKGAGLLAQIAPQLMLEESDLERAAVNRRLVTPIPTHPHRAMLLSDIYRHGFSKAAEKFGSPGLTDAFTSLITSALPDGAVIRCDRLARRIRAKLAKKAPSDSLS